MKTTRLFSAAVLVLGSALVIKADTFTFNDLTESPTLSITGNIGRISNVVTSNGGEITTFTVADPDNAVSTTLKTPIFTELLDSPNGAISDYFIASLHPGGFAYDVQYGSDTEGTPLVPPSVGVAPTILVEDGTVQAVGTVQTGGTDFDFFFLQSDVEATPPIPEPSSIVLGASMLALLFVFRRKLIRTN